MKIGIFVGIAAGARPDSMATVAQHAERLGFGTLWAGEHVVVFDSYESKYPYTDTGEMPLVRDADFLDPIVGLTYAAAVTKTIRLATGICLVPEHNPLVLAKVVATLDWLSNGRVALGVGIGWLEEEFQALGIPWERRAARTRECIDAMRKLWGDPISAYSGEFVKFDGVRSYPKPVRGAELPILFGGESTPALRRVAEYGNGWCGFNLDPGEAAEKIRHIESLLKSNGRKRSDVELAVSPYTKPITPDDLARYRDAGVDEVVIVKMRAPRTPEEAAKGIEEAARKWIDAAAKL